MGKGEQLQVPKAEFRSYYGRQIIKSPVWKTPDVPLYLFFGGMAATSSGLAAWGGVSGRPSLRRTGRLAAAGGAVAGTVFLVHDLHRPQRFLHMLRVFKPTSPLSVGTWILSPFATFAAATAAAEVVTDLVRGQRSDGGRTRGEQGIGRWIRRAGDASGFAAAALGPALGTYTAVLLSNTAVPTWHEAHRELPVLFAGSAAAAGGGMGLIGATVAENAPAARLAVAGAAVELAVGEYMERKLGLLGDVYQKGKASTLMKASKACLAAGIVGTVLGRRRRWSAALSGAALMAGSALTRFGVFEAGMASSRDPAHIVVPQRERIRQREETRAAGTTPPDRAFA
jgi:formate-dependent nitrite reductase membrane component NrfD